MPGDGEDRHALIGVPVVIRERPKIGLTELVAVGLLTGLGIDLVPSHNQHLPPGNGFRADRQLLAGEEGSHRVSAVETVPKIRDKIQPDRAIDRFRFEPRRALKVFFDRHGIERRNHQTPISVAPEHRRQDDVL